jgi:homopolymeric O-antigen transport system permease protein
MLQLAEKGTNDSNATAAGMPLQSRYDADEVDHRSPLRVISARRWAALELLELWSHRQLFYILAERDVKVRYKQSVLGVAWAVLQPLLTMVIFTVLFGKLGRIPSAGKPYAIFSYAGLLPWTFFSSVVTSSSNSLISNPNLITKVYFPRLLIPISAVGAGVMDLMIASTMLLVIMPFYRVGFHLTMMMFPPLVVLTAMMAAAVGILTSGLNVKYRDIRHALPFLIQTWMFLTPVIYPVSFLPHRWRWLLMLNPLSGIIEGFRAAIFGGPFDWGALAASTMIVVLLLLIAAYSFRRMERHFADVI